MRSQYRLVSGTNSIQVRRAAFAIIAAIGLATPAFAATYDFINAGSGDFSNASNWGVDNGTGSAVPGTSDTAASSQGGTTIVSSVDANTIDNLLFGNKSPNMAYTANAVSYTATGVATLEVDTGGSLTISSATNGSAEMGNSAGGNATLNMDGGTLTTVYTGSGDALNGKGSIIFGNSSSSKTAQGPTGTFNMNSGTVNVGNNLVLGYGYSLNNDGATADIATGFATQNGGTVNVTGSVVIGSQGNGTYTMNSGSLLETGTNGDANASGRDAFYVGQQNHTNQTATPTGSVGIFTQTGGMVGISNGLYIANQSNTTGTYTISGGSLSIAGDISVGAATGAGVSTSAPVAASNNAGRFQVNGNGAATITANHMTANTANSTLGFDIGSSAGTSLIDLTAATVGGISYDGSAQLSTSTLVDIDPMNGFTPSVGDVYTLITATSISAVPTLELDGDAFDNSALSIITNGDGTQSLIDTVAAVPEPTSLALLGLAGGFFARRRRA